MNKQVFVKDTMPRVGLSEFKKVQIDTLSYMPLSKKVSAILSGSMEFHADDSKFEYDQEEGNWDDDLPDYDPTNDLLDETDIHDLQKDIIENLQENHTKVTVTPGDTPVTNDEDLSLKNEKDSSVSTSTVSAGTAEVSK